MAQWVGQQGTGALCTGLISSLYLHLSTFLLRRKIVISLPSLTHENLRYQNFSETWKGSPATFFGTVRQKFFDRKS